MWKGWKRSGKEGAINSGWRKGAGKVRKAARIVGKGGREDGREGRQGGW